MENPIYSCSANSYDTTLNVNVCYGYLCNQPKSIVCYNGLWPNYQPTRCPYEKNICQVCRILN